MKYFTHYRQPDSMDCGPTCLRMVAKHYGKNISLQILREKTQIGKEGVNLFGISEAAEAIGFRTQALKLGYNSLIEDASLPAVVHWKQNHFVVLYKVKRRSLLRRDDKLFVADPARGLVTFTTSEFKQAWISDKTNGQEEGIAMLLEPAPLFYESADIEENFLHRLRL